MKAKVNYRDTFDADTNLNRKFSNPEGRIRWLYVAMPELSKSHKGKDLKFGLPAKVFLSSVKSKKIFSWVDTSNCTCNYWYLIAVLEVKIQNINLVLVKQGHN